MSLISVSDGEGSCPGPNKDTRATLEGRDPPPPHFTSKSDFPPGHMSAPLALQVLSPVETVLALSLTNEVTGSSCHQSLLQPPNPFFASDTLLLVHSTCLDSGTRGTNSKS